MTNKEPVKNPRRTVLVSRWFCSRSSLIPLPDWRKRRPPRAERAGSYGESHAWTQRPGNTDTQAKRELRDGTVGGRRSEETEPAGKVGVDVRGSRMCTSWLT